MISIALKETLINGPPDERTHHMCFEMTCSEVCLGTLGTFVGPDTSVFMHVHIIAVAETERLATLIADVGLDITMQTPLNNGKREKNSMYIILQILCKFL